MFKDVVQIKATCTIIWFDFIIVLLIVVVVVFILMKSNAFMYGFVMIILSPRGRLLHAVALKSMFLGQNLDLLPCLSFLMPSLSHSSLSFAFLMLQLSFLSLPSLDCLRIWCENVSLYFCMKKPKSNTSVNNVETKITLKRMVLYVHKKQILK